MRVKIFSLFWLSSLVVSCFLSLQIPIGKTQEENGNISFEQNVIPFTNLRFEDFRFKYEWLGYSFDLDVFVVHKGEVFSLHDLFTKPFFKKFMKKSTCSHVVKRASHNITYGIVLEKFPETLSDYIDYFGFRMVNANFNLSMVKMETFDTWLELGYNLTVLYLPSNLNLAFYDLWSKNFTLHHPNSTCVLMGNVTGKTQFNFEVKPIRLQLLEV